MSEVKQDLILLPLSNLNISPNKFVELSLIQYLKSFYSTISPYLTQNKPLSLINQFPLVQLIAINSSMSKQKQIKKGSTNLKQFMEPELWYKLIFIANLYSTQSKVLRLGKYLGGQVLQIYTRLDTQKGFLKYQFQFI
ncbi:hypothetical protein ABPG74_013702 [Tetrahymena malaccensis]